MRVAYALTVIVTAVVGLAGCGGGSEDQLSRRPAHIQPVCGTGECSSIAGDVIVCRGSHTACAPARVSSLTASSIANADPQAIQNFTGRYRLLLPGAGTYLVVVRADGDVLRRRVRAGARATSDVNFILPEPRRQRAAARSGQ
jgi:hypothetical protein